MLIINDPKHPAKPFALFNMGFRPFFLLAGLYAIIAMSIWIAILTTGRPLPPATRMPIWWHAHEMLFGYAMAVVAGFLLTAIRNWTGQSTLQGARLIILSAVWIAARITLWLTSDLRWSMIFDLLFNGMLLTALSLPVWRTRQTQQIGLLSKILLLGVANLMFWLGVLGVMPAGIHWGLYSGMYLLVALVFNMARRVLPFFIERGVGYPVQLRNSKWVDQSSLVLFFAFWITDVFLGITWLASLLASALAGIHAWRLYGWHTHGIWRKPLLWVLFVGYAIATSGFALSAITPFMSLSPMLALHTFALGGIGIMTMGMMARVALGHTGRNIQQPPRGITPMFLLLVLTPVFRVLMPLYFPYQDALWLDAAAGLWIGGFSLFCIIYTPILIKARIDGQPG